VSSDSVALVAFDLIAFPLPCRINPTNCGL
jgi:hypothetical protein